MSLWWFLNVRVRGGSESERESIINTTLHWYCVQLHLLILLWLICGLSQQAEIYIYISYVHSVPSMAVCIRSCMKWNLHGTQSINPRWNPIPREGEREGGSESWLLSLPSVVRLVMLGCSSRPLVCDCSLALLQMWFVCFDFPLHRSLGWGSECVHVCVCVCITFVNVARVFVCVNHLSFHALPLYCQATHHTGVQVPPTCTCTSISIHHTAYSIYTHIHNHDNVYYYPCLLSTCTYLH